MRTAVVLGLLLCSSVASCRGRPATAPYGDDPAPTARILLERARPSLSAIQVPSAEVRVGRRPAADLVLAAQLDPARFAGSISAAGNELVSIAVNEQEYALRWLRDDGLRPGFYSGPPSPCAVARVLGVPLARDELIALLLGGAVVPPDARVVAQRWDGARVGAREQGHPGHEVLSLVASGRAQDLRFAWVDGAWWFAGTTVWSVDGGKPTWLWTVEHERLHRVDGLVVPAQTRIRRPTGTDQVVLTIVYETQRLDPADLAGGRGTAPDTWDDDWGDEVEEKDAATKTSPIPVLFRLDASGLTARGDLCRPD